MVRKSLDVRLWEAAQKLVRDWEANPVQGGRVTVKEACYKFIDAAEFRNLSEGIEESRVCNTCVSLCRDVDALNHVARKAISEIFAR
jgi:hypothetical protein